MTAKTVIRLIFALTVLVSVFLRPPGTMLVVNGDTITYELCTAGGVSTVTVGLDGEPGATLDLGCDFFAAQIAALPFAVPAVVPTQAHMSRLVVAPAQQTHARLATWRHFAPRAPPLVS